MKSLECLQPCYFGEVLLAEVDEDTVQTHSIKPMLL